MEAEAHRIEPAHDSFDEPTVGLAGDPHGVEEERTLLAIDQPGVLGAERADGDPLLAPDGLQVGRSNGGGQRVVDQRLLRGLGQPSIARVL